MRVRPLLVTAALLVASSFGHASGGDDTDQLTINAKDLRKYFEPYIPGVKDCYGTNAQGRDAKGVLRLELTIHRDGSVVRFGFKAPGVTGASLRRLDTCLHTLSEAWHFPVRRGFTTAIIPLQFVRTGAPGPKASTP